MTILALELRGRLAGLPVFAPPPSFPAALAARPSTVYLRTYDLLARETPAGPLHDAIRDLLARSTPTTVTPSLRDRLRRRWGRWRQARPAR